MFCIMWVVARIRKLIAGHKIPSVLLLKDIERFIHDSNKKLVALNLIFQEIEHGKTTQNILQNFQTLLRNLQDTYICHKKNIDQFVTNITYDASKLNKAIRLIQKHSKKLLKGYFDETLIGAIKEEIRILQQEIYDNLEVKILSYKHSLAEAIEDATNSVQIEKKHQIEQFLIKIEKDIQPGFFSKNIYSEEFIQWKSILLDFLRNGIEAIAKAIELEDIPLERRVVSIQLIEDYKTNSGAIIAIKDQGCGMDEHTRVHFYRNGFSTKRNGMGIGITEDTIQFLVNHGSWKMETAPGKGTTFWLLIE